MPRFTLKMNVYSAISLETHKYVLKPQKWVHFSKTINLRGQMPSFTLKMNVFPSISWESPEICVETLRAGFVFPR